MQLIELDTSTPPDLVNSVTRDRLWFKRVPRSADEPVVFECEIPPMSPGTPLHFHARTDERFECLSGSLSMIVGPKRVVLAPGEDVEVPAKMVHRFWNATAEPVRFRSTVMPGREFERFLRSVYALGNAGRTGPDGMPRNPLKLAVLRELSDLYFAGPPLVLQRVAFGVLSAFAGWTGTRRSMEAMIAESAVRVEERR